MSDDGNRQIAISLMLSPEQFEALDTKLGGIDGAINKLAENISESDTSVAAEISLLRNEVGMRLTAINESAVVLGQIITTASENIGKWLAAIALASADPDDNSAAVQAKIDQLTASLKPEADAFEGAAKPQ
jgi:hypothetical protein